MAWAFRLVAYLYVPLPDPEKVPTIIATCACLFEATYNLFNVINIMLEVRVPPRRLSIYQAYTVFFSVSGGGDAPPVVGKPMKILNES